MVNDGKVIVKKNNVLKSIKNNDKIHYYLLK